MGLSPARPAAVEHARHSADARRHCGFVVADASPVRNLEREDGSAQRCTEQHGEAGRHARDGEDAHIIRREPRPVGLTVSDGPRGGHQRCLGPERATSTDAEERDRHERPQPRLLPVAAVRNVDVVHQQLHVGGLAQQPHQARHGDSHDDEHRQVGRGGPPARADQLLDGIQHDEIGGADRSTERAAEDDAGDDPQADPGRLHQIRADAHHDRVVQHSPRFDRHRAQGSAIDRVAMYCASGRVAQMRPVVTPGCVP